MRQGESETEKKAKQSKSECHGGQLKPIPLPECFVEYTSKLTHRRTEKLGVPPLTPYIQAWGPAGEQVLFTLGSKDSSPQMGWCGEPTLGYAAGHKVASVTAGKRKYKFSYC